MADDGDVLALLGAGDVSDVGSSTEDDEPRDELKSIRRMRLDEFENDVSFEVHQNSVRPPKRNIRWLEKPFEQPEIDLDKLDEPEHVNSLKTPVDYFSEYFGNEMFEKMAFYTNLYAIQKDTGTESSGFTPTDEFEMKAFIAILIIMGTSKCSETGMLCENYITRAVDLIAKTMTQDRFCLLKKNFHVIDNTDIPLGNKDKFIKIRPLYDGFLRKCGSLPVEKNVCINEQMVPFKEHLLFGEFDRGKPIQWGVKIFLLCGERGMVYNILPFQGHFQLDPENINTYGTAASIVLHLTEHLKPNRHYLFFDENFSSFGLFEKLQHLRIYAAGAIKTKRFAKPPLISNQLMRKMGRGTTYEITTDQPNNCNIGLVKWLDYEVMHLASNFVASGEVDKVCRWDKKHKFYVKMDRPEVVKLYSRPMRGLDKMNELIDSCQTFFRSRKWTLRMAMHVFDLAMYNSWLEYKKHAEILKTPKKNVMNLTKFRIKLARSLIKLSKPRRTPSIRVPETVPESQMTNERQADPFQPNDVSLDGVGNFPMFDE